MAYKDFIKAGNKVAYFPFFDSTLTENERVWAGEPMVVKIGKYHPYYTDGTPDPTPDQYEDCCRVEVENCDLDDRQLRLETLFPIEPCETFPIIYDDDEVQVVGKTYDVFGDEFWVVYVDGEERIIEADETLRARYIGELSHNDLKVLRKEIVAGSLYYSDYRNSFSVSPREVCYYCDLYVEELENQYGADCWDYDSPEAFANYIYNGKL